MLNLLPTALTRILINWRLNKGRWPRKRVRAARGEQLEAREMLTASMQIFDGTTQLSTMGSDSFDPATVGDAATKTFTVDDTTGDEDLNISAISLPAGFSLQTALPIDVPAGTSSSFTVSMDTSTATSWDGQVEIDSDDPDSPFYLDLSGTVNPPPPALTVLDGTTAIANDPDGMNPPDDFGSTREGTPLDKLFTISNSSASDISVNSLSLPSGFSLAGGFPTDVPANGSAAFTVQMDAASTSMPSGNLYFTDTDDGGGDQYQFAIGGTVTAPPPALTVLDGTTQLTNGGSDSFGTVTLGASDTRDLTLENTGGATLAISSASLPTGFSSPTALPLDVNPGESATFTVSMNTNSVAAYSGELDLTTNDPNNGTFALMLDGTVEQATSGGTLELLDGATEIANGGSSSFGATLAGSSDSQSFTVKNSASSTLTVSSVSLPAGYSLNTALPFSLDANQSSTLNVSLGTNTVGNFDGQMLIQSSDTSDNPFTVNVSGTVVTSASPSLALADGSTTIANGGSDSFGSATEGASDSRTYVVTNWGSQTLSVSAISLPAGYSTSITSLSLAAGASGTFTVSLDTSSAGVFSGSMVLTSNDPNNSEFGVSLSGAVTAPPAPVMELYDGSTQIANGGSDSFGSVTMGSSDSKAYTVTNAGNAALSISAITLPSGYSLGTALPLSIAADGSGTVIVSMDTATVGAYTGTMTITDTDGGNNPYNVSLTGTVNAVDGSPPVVTTVATTPNADEVSAADGVFTLYRDGPTTSSLTVNYSLGGSSLDGIDYQWLPGTATFAAGSSTTEVDIAPLNNGVAGMAKTAVLTLLAPTDSQSPAPYALAGTTTATVTIADGNLPVVMIFATAPTADATAGKPGEFAVARNGDTDHPLTVNFAVSGSAVAGTNYQPLPSSVTIPAGATFTTIDVTPIDNGAAGTNTSSTVMLTMAASSDYSIGVADSPAPAATSATVIIDDDHFPQVSIAATAPIAVEASATPGDFTISIDSAQPSDLTIPYSVTGSAAPGTDFEALSGTATIPAGQTSVVIPVVPVNDPAEYGFTTVAVTVSPGAGYELTASKHAIVSIEGNITPPTITLQATTPVADEIAGTSGVFTVTRTGDTTNALTAYYTIAGAAVDGTDYGLLPGSVTIPAGQASTTILITPLNDPAMQDSSRAVTLNLTNYGGPSGARYGIGSPAGGSVTIDDLPTVSIQATTPTAQEHELTAGVFTVSRANDPLVATQALAVNYTIGGTAAGGTDYQTLTGSVTLPAGQTTATINVTPIDRGLVGGSQTVALSLSPGGYLIASAASDTVTIEDDDPPTTSIQATTSTASERTGAAGAFTVSRNGPTTNALILSYNVSGTATAGTDYQSLPGSVTIPAGESTATIAIAPIDIEQVGGATTVIVALSSGADYALGSLTNDTVTIEENDLPTLALNATQAHATESGTTGTFTVTRNGDTTNPLVVLYTTGGTAANGADYEALSGNVTIPAGQTSASITVTPINDPAVEQDQTVVLTLASTSQYVAGSQYSGTVTIFDDNPPSVTVTATANANEQAGTAGTFTVTRVGPTDNPLDVSYTMGGTSQAGVDYAAPTGAVTIPAGQSSATVSLVPLADATAETQQIVVPAATGGTFTLSALAKAPPGVEASASDSTAPLSYNATAADVQAALALLPEIGVGNVAVSGQGTRASPFVVQFLGGLVGIEVPLLGADGSQLTGIASASVSTITAGQSGTSQVDQVGYMAGAAPTGGTFTLTLEGDTTAPIAYNASVADVQAALAALPNVGAGNVSVSALDAGPDTFTWQVTYQGPLAGQFFMPGTTTDPTAIVVAGGASADDQTISTGGPGGGTNAVQLVTLAGAVGGTLTLGFGGSITAPIAYNATADDVQTALNNTGGLGSINYAVTGDAGGPYTVTFQYNLGDQAVADLTADASGLTPATISTALTAAADGQRTVVFTLASSTNYTIGTLSAATASGGTGASDTLSIADPGNNSSPTIVAASYSTLPGQALTVAAPGVLTGSADPNANAVVTAALLSGPADGTVTLNADGSFSYLPNAGFQGMDSFFVQGFDGTTYSVPAVVAIVVAPLPAPQISLAAGDAAIANGGTLAFGQTWTGTPLTQTVTITNGGTADLMLSNWALPAGFSVVTAPDADVAPGDSTTITLQMDATAAGTSSGEFSLDDNVPGQGTVSITLSGTVNAPAPTLAVLDSSGNVVTDSFAFGATAQNEPLTDTFTVQNTGTADLALTDPIILPDGFTLAQDFAATTLAPGASTTFAVELATAATGTSSGNLSFAWGDDQNADEFSYTLPLSGMVVAGAVIAVLEGASTIDNGSAAGMQVLNFGTALLGTTLTKTFTIENNGTSTLTLDPTQLTLPAGFSVVTPYAASLAPGAATTLELEIDGSTAGDFAGAVSFPTNDVRNPTFSFPIAGTIVTPAPQLELLDGAAQVAASSGSVDFGSTPEAAPVDVPLTIENVGTADLVFESGLLLPSGYRVVSFAGQSNPPPDTIDLAPGASIAFTLELQADGDGAFAGTAEIDSNDPAQGTFDFNLTGAVTAPQAQISLAGAAIDDTTGSVDFGNAAIGSSVTNVFTVTNSGQAPLVLTDPIGLPPDFAVAGDFGATTLAPGASTTFAIEFDPASAGQYAGAAMIETNDPDQELYYFHVSGESGVPMIAVSDGSSALAPDESSGGATLDDFGSTAVGASVEQVINVTNSGTGTLTLSDPIHLPEGFSLVSDFGATTLAPGASTSFTVAISAAAAGFYAGDVSFGTSAALSLGAGQPRSAGTPLLTGAFAFAVAGGVAQPRLDIAQGATDISDDSQSPTSGGQTAGQVFDFGATVVGAARTDVFTVTNTGSAELDLTGPIDLPDGFALVQDFGATALAPGASTTFSVELTAAAAGAFSGAITFGTNLPASAADGSGGNAPTDYPPGAVGGTFTLYIQGEALALSDLRLLNDTGYSSTDGRTSDPSVTGAIVGLALGAAGNGGSPLTPPPQAIAPSQGESGQSSTALIIPTGLTIEFELNGDGTVDGTAVPDATGDFDFTPPSTLPLGAVIIGGRLHLQDAVFGDLYSSWLPLSFFLETGTNVAPVVTNLALQTVSVAGASPPTSSDPIVTGLVLNDGTAAGITIEIDTTGSAASSADASSDASTSSDSGGYETATTAADGTFSYAAQDLAPGTYTYDFRAVENTWPSGQIAGQWQSFTFAVVAAAPPVVDQLALASALPAGEGGGGSTPTALDPTLTGHVTADGNPQKVEVDFSYNGDGAVDASTTANPDGTFTFTPSGLADGNVTIEVRAVNVDKNIIGLWTSFSFRLFAPQAPSIASLALANETGGAGSNTTDNPSVTGTLAPPSVGPATSLAGVTVQFDTSGGGVPDGSTITDDNGDFTWLPSGLSPGTVTIAARAVTTDPATGGTVLGTWKSITFTYSTAAGPAVSSLSLAHPTGTDATTGLPTAIDATIAGTLTDGTQLAAFLTVQYIVNPTSTGAGQSGGSSSSSDPSGSSITGSTIADASGNFSFAANGLPVGSNTIEVRGVTQDPETGQEIDGAWSTVTFILQQNPIDQPPVVPGDDDPVATGDQVAATSEAANVQAVDAAIQSFNNALGAGGTASGQIALGIGTYMALAGMVGGRVVSGSIYGVENGSLPAPAGLVAPTVPGGDSFSGPSLPSSSPVGLPDGTPLNVSNLATPQAASGTISNLAISADGTIGPGTAVLSGTLDGSWNITVAPDGNNNSVTDWAVTINLGATFDNSLAGSYADTGGAAAINHNYNDDVGGTYSFILEAVGTTTQTPDGAIVAGTYTLVEQNAYSFTFSDTPTGSASATGSNSTSSATLTATGSHSFTHLEPGGSFSVGGGLPDNGDDSVGNGLSAVPQTASTFASNEIESYGASDSSSQSYANSSADGTNNGAGTSDDDFTATRDDFQSGGYSVGSALNGAPASWSDGAAFLDDVRETDNSSESDTSNFNDAAVDGQINGGSNDAATSSASFSDAESGQWNATPTSYTLDPSFDVQESDSESDESDQAGNTSDNENGTATSGTFLLDETDSDSESHDLSGDDQANGTDFTVTDGAFDDSETAGDTIDYSDTGTYQGAINGNYHDSDDETDTATDGDNGTFSESDGEITDQGQEHDHAESDDTFNSGGAASQTDDTGTYGDNYSDKGTDDGTFDNNGSFGDSPTLDSADGTATLDVTDTDHATAGDYGTVTTPNNLTYFDNLTDDSTDSVDVTDNYNDTSDPASGTFDDIDTGTATENDSDNQTVNWGDGGTVTGALSYTFNDGGNGNAIATDDVTDNFDDSDSVGNALRGVPDGETDTDSGTFSDSDDSNVTAFSNDFGTQTSPDMTVKFTDNDNQTEIDDQDETDGTFSDGASDDVAANFNDTDDITDNEISTADGTVNSGGPGNQGAAGTFSAVSTDDSIDDSTDNGNYNDGATDNGTDDFTRHDSDHTTLNEKDSGSFTGSVYGTYSDTHDTDDLTTDDILDGVATTTNSQTTSTGNYNDATDDTENDTSNVTQHQGPITYTDGTTNYSHPTTDDDGTFDDTAAGDTINGGFNDALNARTTDHATESGSWTNFYSGTVDGVSDAGTKTTDTANGSETGDANAPTRSGTETDDELDTDSGSLTNTSSLDVPGLTTHFSHTNTWSDDDHDHSTDDFTTGGAARRTNDVNYNDDDRAKREQIEASSTAESLGGGFTASGSYNTDDTQKATDTDIGEDDQTATGETDIGTATDTDHDTSKATTTYQDHVPLGDDNDSGTSGDVYDDRVTDDYNINGGGQTDDETFHIEDRPYVTYNNQWSYAVAGDPGTNASTSDVGSGQTDDVDDGTADVINGQLTDETDNFNDKGQSQETTTRNAASDQFPAVQSTVQTVPWLIPAAGTLSWPWPNNPTPFGSIMEASYSGPITSISSDTSTDTGTENDHQDGTTTVVNGAVSTNEEFGDTATDQFSDNFSQTVSGSYNGSTGSGTYNYTQTAGDQGTETDTDNGTSDDGVTSDHYNDNGNSTITQTTTINNNATSAMQDEQSTGAFTTLMIATETITSGASGDDTTEPSDTTDPAPVGVDANNPDVLGSFATADQKSSFTITITNSDTETRSGTTTGGADSPLGIFYVSDDASYKATGGATIISNSIVDVNQAQGINTRDGSLSSDAWETQTADYTLSYSQTWPGMDTRAGGMQSHSVHSGYNDTDGPYGSGTQTNQTGASDYTTGTGWQTPGQPSSESSAYSSGWNNKTTTAAGPAPEAPPGAGAYTAAGHTPPSGFQLACFAAGTPVRTPDGWKVIEQFLPGDLVLASPDTDPESRAEAKTVLRVYANPPDRLINVHVGSQVIRATLDHPFYVRGAGWTGASRLRTGDQLLSHDGRWVSVTEIYDNGNVEPVYNLCVQDHHTYFLGKPDWGFSVLVHNQSGGEKNTVDELLKDNVDPETAKDAGIFAKGDEPTFIAGFNGRTQFSGDRTGINEIVNNFRPNKKGEGPSAGTFTWNGPFAIDLGAVKTAVDELKGDQVVHIVIIGYSFGADRAIKEAGALYDKLKAAGVDMTKVQIDLALIDGVSSQKGASYGKPITSIPEDTQGNLHSLTNYYQTIGSLHGAPVGQIGTDCEKWTNINITEDKTSPL